MEGPGAGQVLPETQLPPKQSPSCLLITGPGGILRALPRKGPGTGHKGCIFPGELRGAWCRQLPGRTPYVLPMATVMAVLGPRCLLPPPCCAMPRADRCHLGPSEKLLAGCGLSFSKTHLQKHGRVLCLPSRCCTNTSRAGCPAGTKSVPEQSRSQRSPPPAKLCRRSPAPSQLHHGPGSIASQHSQGDQQVGDMGFPARGIPHGANPGSGSLQDVAPVQTHFAGADVLFPFSPCPCARH